MVTTKLKESKKVLKNRKRPIQKLTRPSNWQLKNQKTKNGRYANVTNIVENKKQES